MRGMIDTIKRMCTQPEPSTIHVPEPDIIVNGGKVLHETYGTLYDDTGHRDPNRKVAVKYTSSFGEEYHYTTPLIISIANNKPDLFRKLISNGADINLCGDSGQSPVNIAVILHRPLFVKALIEKGVDITSDSCIKGDFSLQLARLFQSIKIENKANIGLPFNNYEMLNDFWKRINGLPRYDTVNEVEVFNKLLEFIKEKFGVEIDKITTQTSASDKSKAMERVVKELGERASSCQLRLIKSDIPRSLNNNLNCGEHYPSEMLQALIILLGVDAFRCSDPDPNYKINETLNKALKAVMNRDPSSNNRDEAIALLEAAARKLNETPNRVVAVPAASMAGPSQRDR